MTLVKPTNGVVVEGEPTVHMVTLETATTVYPGRLMERGTADHQRVVCTAGGKATGVAGYEHTPAKYKKDHSVDTIYTDDDLLAELSGDLTFVGSLANGQSVVIGEHLKAAAAGELAAGTPGTDHIVAIAAETKDASGGAEDIMASWVHN